MRRQEIDLFEWLAATIAGLVLGAGVLVVGFWLWAALRAVFA